VDFPLPEAPVTATNWPSGIVIETLLRIVRSSVPERTILVTFVSSIIGKVNLKWSTATLSMTHNSLAAACK
jgi:hypothetical protein